MAVDLGIQDIGQFWDGTEHSVSSEACGLACLKACMVWLKISAPTLNQLIRESELPQGAKGLTCQEVADNGTTWGMDCRIETLSLDQLKAHLDAGRPVIVELDYADVPRSWVQDKPFLGFHFETCSGYTDDGSFLMDDPDRITIYGTWGTDIPYTAAVLDKAMTDSYEHRQCVVVYGLLQPPLRHAAYVNTAGGLKLRQTPNGIILREPDGVSLLVMPDKSPLWQIQTNVKAAGGWTWDFVQFDGRYGYCAHELTSDSGVPPQPVINWVNDDGVNVRASASTIANKLGQLNKGDVITLTGVSLVNGTQANGQPRTWLQIIWQTGVAYIAREFTQTIPFPKTPPVVVIPPPKTAGGWGLHALGGVAVPDTPYPVYKDVDSPGFLRAAIAKFPNAMHIHRNYAYHNWQTDPYITSAGGPDPASDKWIHDMSPDFTQFPQGTWVEGPNEKGNSPLYWQFEAFRAEKLKKLGYLAMCMNMACASYPDNMWEQNVQAIQRIAVAGGALGIHYYFQTWVGANAGSSYFDQSGNWHGLQWPTDMTWENCWTGLRVIRDRHFLAALGINIPIVGTEIGADDLVRPGNGIYYPREGKQRGWRTCLPTWTRLGWLSGTTPENLYKKQLDWWAQKSGILGCVYTYGTGGDQEWSSFNVEGLV